MGNNASVNLAQVLSNSLHKEEAVVLSSQADYLKPLGSTLLLALMGSNIASHHKQMPYSVSPVLKVKMHYVGAREMPHWPRAHAE